MSVRNHSLRVLYRLSRLPRLLIGTVLLAACAAAPPGADLLRTHYVHIQDAVTPSRLDVHVGEEVRWQNLRSEPVKISLLSHLSGSNISCHTGFSRFGILDDTAMIPPNAYVSLCFARAGSIQYNVWLRPEDPLNSMTPTAKIVVTASSS